MSNDDRLVPRDYTIPVSVRRPPPEGVDPALLPPQGVPPALPSQHVIYINNNIPAQVPAAVVAPPAAPPAVIHHHHYTTNQTTQRISYRIPTVRSNSALGTASLAMGIIACVVCWVPWLGLVAVPVGAIGALLGVLGVLISVLFRRSSAGLPFAGLFICCLAAGISIASTKTLPFWRKQLDRGITSVLPQGVNLRHSLAPTAVPSTPAPPPPLPPFNLFGSSSSPAQTLPPSSDTRLAPSPHPASPKTSAPPKLDATITAAWNQMTAAEKACDERTKLTPAYEAAVKAAADARSTAVQFRQSFPGSPQSLQASRDMISADNAVTDTLTQAEAIDPDVVAARNALSAARSAAAH